MPVFDIQTVQAEIEASIEELVRIADKKINWTSGTGKGYIFLPGVYKWEANKSDMQHKTLVPAAPLEKALDPEHQQAASDTEISTVINGYRAINYSFLCRSPCDHKPTSCHQ